jgi:4-carboxymuconolactone decarboxylase
MKHLAMSLLLPMGIVLAGGVLATVHAQGEVPAMPASSQPDTNQQPTRAQQLMGDIAPKMAELTDTVLFGDIWERPQLSKRDRSLVTVSALIALNRPEQLRYHLALAPEWLDGTGADRSCHSFGVLCGLAQCGHGGLGREGSLQDD